MFTTNTRLKTTRNGFRIWIGSVDLAFASFTRKLASSSSSHPSSFQQPKNELLSIRNYSNYLHNIHNRTIHISNSNNINNYSSSYHLNINNIRCLNNMHKNFVPSSSICNLLVNSMKQSPLVTIRRSVSNTRPHNLFSSEFKPIDNNNRNDIDDRLRSAGLISATKSHISKTEDPTLSWNDTINCGRKIANYKLDLYQKLFKDPKLKEQIDLDYMLTNEHFHQFLRYYLKTYNHQITGLITILFTKLFLYSSQLLPELLSDKQLDSSKSDSQVLSGSKASSVVCLDDLNKRSKLLEKELGIVAECYDLLSYGFFFHEMISNLDEKTKSFQNLLLLLGDYFLIKSSYDIVGFSRIDLYKIHVAAFGKFIEGEGLTFTSDDKTTIDSDQSTHNNFTTENESIERLIEYCFLTNGQLVASSLQSTFYMANFSHKAQMLAYEFGKNIGIALKISNQLSALFQTRFGVDKSEFVPGSSSFMKKFPSVSVETMQLLVNQYANRSIELLQLLCNIGNAGYETSMPDQGTSTSSQLLYRSLNIPENSPLYKMLNSHQINGNDEYGNLSEQSILLLKALVQIINEITHFNDNFFVKHNNNNKKKSF